MDRLTAKGFLGPVLLVCIGICNTFADPERRVACWGSFGPPVVSVQCPRNTVIQVVRAGLRVQRSGNGCKYDNNDCGCLYGESGCNMPNVRQLCMGRAACRLDVTQQYIETGNCQGFTDYMFVDFNCVNVDLESMQDICTTAVSSHIEGFILSPNYPRPSPANRHCQCTLQASNNDGIELTVLDINIEHCSQDSLLVEHEGVKSDLCTQRMGTIKAPKIVVVEFQSERNTNNGGFWIKYEGSSTVDVECVSTYKKKTHQTTESTTATFLETTEISMVTDEVVIKDMVQTLKNVEGITTEPPDVEVEIKRPRKTRMRNRGRLRRKKIKMREEDVGEQVIAPEEKQQIEQEIVQLKVEDLGEEEEAVFDEVMQRNREKDLSLQRNTELMGMMDLAKVLNVDVPESTENPWWWQFTVSTVEPMDIFAGIEEDSDVAMDVGMREDQRRKDRKKVPRRRPRIRGSGERGGRHDGEYRRQNVKNVERKRTRNKNERRPETKPVRLGNDQGLRLSGDVTIRVVTKPVFSTTTERPKVELVNDVKMRSPVTKKMNNQQTVVNDKKTPVTGSTGHSRSAYSIFEEDGSLTVTVIAAGAVGSILLIIIIGIVVRFVINRADPRHLIRQRHKKECAMRRAIGHRATRACPGVARTKSGRGSFA